MMLEDASVPIKEVTWYDQLLKNVKTILFFHLEHEFLFNILA